MLICTLFVENVALQIIIIINISIGVLSIIPFLKFYITLAAFMRAVLKTQQKSRHNRK